MPLDPHKPYPIRPRLRDVMSYIGIRGYLITIATYRRRTYFVQPRIVESVIHYLRFVCDEEGFDGIAYTCMPDHIHLVLVGKTENSDLNRFVKNFKQRTAYQFKKAFEYQLWSTSFHDHVLRKEEDIKTVGRYTLKNPVRAGIVEHVLDYPFSGSFVYDVKDLVFEDPFLSID